MSANGQHYVDPSSIPARPWAAGITTAAAAAASEQHTAAATAAAAASSPEQQVAAGDWQVTALAQRISGVGSSGSSSSSVVNAAGAAAAAAWDDAFVQQVLSAVQESTAQSVQRRAEAVDGSSSVSEVGQYSAMLQQQQLDLGSLAQLDRSRAGSAQRQQQQQQQQANAAGSIAQQQQQQAAFTAVGSLQQQQQQQQPGSSVADARIWQLLSIVKEQQQQQQQQQRSVSQPLQDWGYYGSAAAAAPCLQRAQWLAEEISRVQYSSTYSAVQTGNTNSSSEAALHQQQQQQSAEDYSLDLLPGLQRQLQQQLIAHLRQEVSSWQDVARVYEMFADHLNPGIVCWCLTALQRVYRQGLVAPGQQKQAAGRLMQQLLRLVWHWQQQLSVRVSELGLLHDI
jgi:hypothetical protein